MTDYQQAQLQQQIADLTTEIDAQEAELSELETEVLDLRRELNEFQQVYGRVVRPAEMRLEAAQAVFAELEDEHDEIIKQIRLGDPPPEVQSTWEPPEGYVSVEEQYRRAWTPAEDSPAEEPRAARPKPRSARSALDDREVTLKRVYRKLARRYHPDLATSADERRTRNTIMAHINEAYTARDLESLQALANQPGATTPEAPLATLRLQELRQIHQQLIERISQLKLERDMLFYSDLMQLKLEAKLAKRFGRDVLAELVTQYERDYDLLMRRIDRLRVHLNQYK